MHILLIYETYSGGTMAAADIVSRHLSTKGHNITVKRANEVTLPDFNSYDFIIVATPSWLERKDEGQPHENFLKLMDTATESTSFSGKKFALFGLGDETYAHFGRGIDRVGAFITKYGGEITVPTLKIDGYLFSPKQSEEKLLSWLDSLPLN